MMACNNTMTPGDVSRARGSETEPSHPSAPPPDAAADAVVRARYPQSEAAAIELQATLIEESPEHQRWFEEMCRQHVTREWAASVMGVTPTTKIVAPSGTDLVGIARDGRVAVFETDAGSADPSPSAYSSHLGSGNVEKALGSAAVKSDADGQGATPNYVRYKVDVGYRNDSVSIIEVTDGPRGPISKVVATASLRGVVGKDRLINDGRAR